MLKGLGDDPRVKELPADSTGSWTSWAHGSTVQIAAGRAGTVAASAAARGFRDRYNEAIFHETRFTGLDLPGNEAATRRSAVAALDVYAAPGSGDPGRWNAADEPVRVRAGRDRRGLLRAPPGASPRPRPRPSRACAGWTRRLDCPRRRGLLLPAGGLPGAGGRRGGGRTGAPRRRGSRPRRRSTITWPGRRLQAARAGRGDPAFRRTLRCNPTTSGPNACRRSAGSRSGGPRRPGPASPPAWSASPNSPGSTSSAASPRAPAPRRLTAEESRSGPRRPRPTTAGRWSCSSGSRTTNCATSLLVNRGVLGSSGASWRRRPTCRRRSDSRPPSRLRRPWRTVCRKQGQSDEAVEQFGRPSSAGRTGRHCTAVGPTWFSRKDSTQAQRAQALADLDRAIRLEKPDNPVLARDHTNRGRLLALDGREPRPWRPARPRSSGAREYADAHRLRLDLLLRLKRHDDVIRSCDALIAGGRHRPRSTSGAPWPARHGDFAGRHRGLHQCHGLRGPAELLRRRGWLYIVADSPRLALHDFQEAIRLDPSAAMPTTAGASLACDWASTARGSPMPRGPSPSASRPRISSTRPPGCTPWPPSSSRPRPARTARRACAW